MIDAVVDAVVVDAVVVDDVVVDDGVSGDVVVVDAYLSASKASSLSVILFTKSREISSFIF